MLSKDILLDKVRSGAPLAGREQVHLASVLSYPAILAQLSIVLMQYIDTSMVGHLGSAAGASIGIVAACLWLFGGFLMMVRHVLSVWLQPHQLRQQLYWEMFWLLP